jgi:hypothetical protein
MPRSQTLLTLTLTLSTVSTISSAAAAPAADDTSTDDSAPFANSSKSPAPFAASPSSGFGAIGQWVLSMRTTQDSGFFFFQKTTGDGGSWELNLHPAIDYFLTGRFSVGGTVGIAYSPRDAGSTWLDIGARAGFNLNINDNVGWWPTIGISAHHENVNHTSSTSTAMHIFSPFLYHLVPHLFAGAGPSFTYLISGGDGSTYGLDFILGGWL